MNHLIRVRLMLALAISATVGALGFSHSGTQTLASPVAAEAGPAQAEIIPTLPTIYVRADAEIPTLPLVVVRADAPADGGQEISLAQVSTAGGAPSLGMPDVLPHVRLDMPYYSFGKLLPRTIKE
jgi:hypothetical protein